MIMTPCRRHIAMACSQNPGSIVMAGWLRGSRAASWSFFTTHSSVGSVVLPIPRSMMSTPATRFSYFILLMRPNKYGGKRWMRGDTSILKHCFWLMFFDSASDIKEKIHRRDAEDAEKRSIHRFRRFSQIG